MQGNHITLGKEGEARAAVFLRQRGYRILAQNVRSGGVEIDIVASRPRLIAFVEVKTRSGRTHGSPEEAVNARKRARLVRGAAAWLHDAAATGRHVFRSTLRFDVIACEYREDGSWEIRHIEAAFDAGEGF